MPNVDRYGFDYSSMRADETARREGRMVWLHDGRIITRNADGGTTAWEEQDAVRLYESLGVLLEGLGLKGSNRG